MSDPAAVIREALTQHFKPGLGGCGRCGHALAALDELEAELARKTEAVRLSELAIRRLVMQHGYPESAKTDLREAHNAILAAKGKS